jgi:hypothetical protein
VEEILNAAACDEYPDRQPIFLARELQKWL